VTESRPLARNGQPAIEAALEALAEEILCSIVDGGFCSVQDWDHRIDCCVKLADGQIVGGMVPLATLSSAVIRAVGERLNYRIRDECFELHNKLTPPS